MIVARANPTLTAKGVVLRGRVTPEIAPSTGGHPTGTVSWKVTSANGPPVSCASEVTKLAMKGSAELQDPTAPLSAAQSPYTVTLSYPGDPTFGASIDTLILAVSPAHSQTKLTVAARGLGLRGIR